MGHCNIAVCLYRIAPRRAGQQVWHECEFVKAVRVAVPRCRGPVADGTPVGAPDDVPRTVQFPADLFRGDGSPAVILLRIVLIADNASLERHGAWTGAKSSSHEPSASAAPTRSACKRRKSTVGESSPATGTVSDWLLLLLHGPQNGQPMLPCNETPVIMYDPEPCRSALNPVRGDAPYGTCLVELVVYDHQMVCQMDSGVYEVRLAESAALPHASLRFTVTWVPMPVTTGDRGAASHGNGDADLPSGSMTTDEFGVPLWSRELVNLRTNHIRGQNDLVTETDRGYHFRQRSRLRAPTARAHNSVRMQLVLPGTIAPVLVDSKMRCPWCELACLSVYGFLKHCSLSHSRFVLRGEVGQCRAQQPWRTAPVSVLDRARLG